MAKQNGTRTQAQTPSYKIVYGIVKRGESSFWTRIGAAFENRDGSLNIKLDFLPASIDTTLQVREPRANEEAD